MKKLLNQYCLPVFLIIISLHSMSQNTYVDSLKKVIAAQKEDTNKVDAIASLNYYYANAGDYDNTMQTAQQILTLSTKINYKEGIAYFNLAMALAYSIKQDRFLEMEYYNKALVLYKATGDQQFIMSCYDNMTNAFVMEGNYGKALENRYASQKIREQIGDKKMIADGFFNIATAYGYSPNNTDKILKNLFAALNLYKQTGDKKSIGACYSMIGTTYASQQKYTEAIDELNRALEIFKGNNTPDDIGMAYLQIGYVYKQEGDSAYNNHNTTAAISKYNKAKDYYFIALKTFTSSYYYTLQSAACFVALGQINMKLVNFSTAKKYFDSSLAIYQSAGAQQAISLIYYNLSQLDSMQMNYKDAYKNYQLYHKYNDSLHSEENTKKATQAQMQYEFDKKESTAQAAQDKKDAEAKRIKHEQYFAIAALGIIVLAVIAIAFIQFKNKQQKQRANLVLEKTLANLKSTQQQLIQSEKMASLGELTAGIAHEIQNPLNFVNNFSDVNKELLVEMKDEMNKGNIDDANAIANDVIDNEEKINHHGKRADAIVKNMLQHSKQTKGVKEPTDVNALCDEYLRLSFHGLRAKDKSFNADFKRDFDESIKKINIVPQDIGRVLLNLFNNAFYAVNEKLTANRSLLTDNYQPTVSVQTKKINDKVEIVVSDNGNGIPQNIIDKIFQPFFTTKPTGQGTGLGLSLAYDIITKEHNGTIKVNSKEGNGTAFTIQVPV